MFTEFDILVIIILLVFSFLVASKGFITEFLDLISYLGAAFFTYFFYSYALSMISPNDKSNFFINLGVVLGLFLLSYLLLYLFKLGILSVFSGGVKSFFDKFLGLILGFVKGFFIIGTVHFIILLTMVDSPEWLKKGATFKLTEYSYKTIIGFMGSSHQSVLAARDSNYKRISETGSYTITAPATETIENPPVSAPIENIPADKEAEEIKKEIKEEINKEINLDTL